jgi:hypothetical protein
MSSNANRSTDQGPRRPSGTFTFSMSPAIMHAHLKPSPRNSRANKEPGPRFRAGKALSLQSLLFGLIGIDHDDALLVSDRCQRFYACCEPPLANSELGLRIREAIAHAVEAERRSCDFGGENADANARWDERLAELNALEAQIPNPPQSLSDVIARAEIAHFGADKEMDDRTMVSHDEDCFEGPAVRLIKAVLLYAGLDCH